jgi:two-component system, LytTR family, sensor histidine kinase AlgZ
VVDLFLDTLAALARPRRLVPILIVSVPLVIAQHALSLDPNADAVGIIMVLLFLGLGPFSYRALFGEVGFRGTLRAKNWLHPGPWLRLGVFGAVGALPTAFGFAAPFVLDLPFTFLTYPVNLAVATALFWVGSWGLARDIVQEHVLARERARADALAREAEHARLLALEAHLDPHFLFNTLNAIAEWVQQDPAHAERALLELSAVLREVMEGVRRPTWPLSREIALVRAVWDLHAVRDPERFAADLDVPSPLPTLEVPPMVLLPLAENAVKHGPGKGHAGRLALRVAPGAEAVVIVLSNPGPCGAPREGGEGLPMVRRRLSLHHGEGATLTLSTEAGRCVARVVLPA